ANDQFQALIRHRRSTPQLVRHEALSLLWCRPDTPLGRWLRGGVVSDADYLLALASAAGHHRKFARDAVAPDGSGAGMSITLLGSHPDMPRLLESGRAWLSIGAPPALDDTIIRANRSE